MNTLSRKKDSSNVKFEDVQVYTVPGDPIALARHRHSGNHIYDAQKLDKLNVGLLLGHQHGSRPLFKGALCVNFVFYLPIPKSSKKNGVLQGRYHIYRPDISNLIKFYEDVSNKILFDDDCLIAVISAKKVYDDDPRTEFTIREL